MPYTLVETAFSKPLAVSPSRCFFFLLKGTRLYKDIPELDAQAILITPDTRYGGHVRARVVFRLNPSVPTIVGKKFLKLDADM